MQIIGYNSLLLAGPRNNKPDDKPYDQEHHPARMNSGNFGAMITFLAKLLQWPTTLSVKNLFLMSCLIFSWHNFVSFLCVLMLATRKQKSALPPSLLPLRKSQNQDSMSVWDKLQFKHKSCHTSLPSSKLFKHDQTYLALAPLFSHASSSQPTRILPFLTLCSFL